MRKPNLIVLGASGGVANSFLHYLVHYRPLFNKLILLDKRKNVLSDPYICHKDLNYSFIHKELKFPRDEEYYQKLLKKNKINVVLDVTDADSIPLIEATNRAGINYINTAMNDDKKNIVELIYDVYPRRNKINKARHILCAGMNPGVVNMWVRYGIEKFGVPKEIIHFEYDTAKIAKKWKPMMTWSIKEFLVENVRDPSGVALGRGEVKQLFPNALKYRVNMKSILQPILKLDKYPRGFVVLHEENLTIAQKYNVPSKFIYAINLQTMENLIKIYQKRKKVTAKDLIKGDNTNVILDGSDNIGVILRYKDKDVYYFNTIPNNTVMGTSATYLQTVIGVFAALFVLLYDNLSKGVYFPEDLFNTHFKSYVFENMRVQEFVFKKQKTGLKILSYNPEIRVKNKNTEHTCL
jgi:hypothetical protein